MKRMSQMVVGRRRFLGGTLAAAALAALSACSPGNDAGEEGSAAVEQPIAIGFTRPASIDPAHATDESGLAVVWQLFDPLMSYDFSTGELSCLAADRYEASDDARTFTFYVRDATFHDGTPVSSMDFKRAWERIASPESAPNRTAGSAPYAYLLSFVEGYDELRGGETSGLAGLTCPDEATLRISLSTPYADLPYLLAHPVLGPVPATADDDLESFSQQPVGNGPFKMASAWKSGSGSISLVRNEDYYGDAPLVDAARFDVETDASSSFRSFQTGDLDVASCPITDASDASSRLKRSDDGRTLGDDGRFLCATDLTTCMLACNCSAGPLTDPVLRRAISLAIDREYISDTLYRKTLLPADGVVPPTVHGYREGAWPYTAFDASQASDLLEEAHPADKDGERGVTVRLAYDTDGGHAEVMKQISSNLADIGITCRLEALGADTLRQRVADGDFDLARVDWTADAPTMDSVLFPLFFSACSGTTNCSRYQNADVDGRLAQARTELDDDARVSTLQGTDDAVAADCPVIPLTYHARSLVASSRVAHLTVDPQGRLGLSMAEFTE